MEPLLQRIRDANVAVIHDQIDNSRWQMLRSLPAVHYLGVEDFTYPTSWRQLGGWQQYDFLGYTYHVLDEGESVELPPFGVITNHHYEWETPYSIQGVVSRYKSAEMPLIVVSDDPDFQPEGSVRPLAQEQFAERIGAYKRVYDAFERQYAEAGFSLPLRDTQNLFVQDNAILYELVTEEQLRSIEELFDILPDAPYLPLYDVFSEIFSRDEEFGSVPLETEDDVEDLARWLRRRIEWERRTANEVAQSLNRAVADAGQTFDPSYANRSPTVVNARRVGRELDSEKSSIHARYQEWLTRFDP